MKELILTCCDQLGGSRQIGRDGKTIALVNQRAFFLFCKSLMGSFFGGVWVENHINMRELQRKRSQGTGKDKGGCVVGVCLYIFFPFVLNLLLLYLSFFLFLLKLLEDYGGAPNQTSFLLFHKHLSLLLLLWH